MSDSLPVISALLNAVESTIVIARDCVQDAGEKFKESAMFYATARQRNAEKEMSEATLRKMHRKAEILESEVKAKLAKAFAQLRHAVHHYTEVKRDVEQGLLDRENKLAERHQVDAKLRSLEASLAESRVMAERLGQEKEQAAVKTSLAESSATAAADELQQMQQERSNMQAQLAEAHAQIEQLRSALDRKDNALEACTQRLQLTLDDVQQAKQQLAASFANEQTLTRKLNKAKDAIANLTADNVTHIGRVQFLEQKFSVALKEREQARSDLAKSDEQWFAQLRLEVERVTRAHMQEMDQCERRLQDARTARDGDRAEQAAAMAAANARNAELQKALQQLQDQQRLAERAHDNCRRDLEQQMASNEELSSEMQQLLQQLRSTESLAETLEHENEQRRTALEQQSARIGLLVQHLEEADSAMKEHADVSESLSRRLREEAEVNAALSQAKHAAEMQFLSQRAENKVLQEELAKFKQQSEKARVQKLQQARSMQGKTAFGSSSNSMAGGAAPDEAERSADHS